MPLPLTSLLAAALVLAVAPAAFAQAPKPDPATVKALAPTGKLRAGINLGNGVLAQKDPKTGELKGVSVRLAMALGKELGVPVELIPYKAAADSVEGGASGAWDVGFVARDPARAGQIAFTAPYVLIEGTYMVRADSPYHAAADLDRDGVRIAVGTGAAYDLYLTRALKHATLVRGQTSAGAIELFMKDKTVDAAAGVGAALNAAAKGHADVRVIHPGYQTIEQTMAVPKGHDVALAYVQSFVERMKANGFVRRGLDETGQTDADVAPPAG